MIQLQVYYLTNIYCPRIFLQDDRSENRHNGDGHLTLLEITTKIRECFKNQGSSEVPAFPELITQPWLHPDLLSRCFSETAWDLFAFQPVGEEKGLGIFSESRMPTLVWMKKPFSVDWLHRIPAFLTSVLHPAAAGTPEEPPPSEPKSFLEVWGVNEKSGLFSDIGCRWNLVWKGVPIGSVKLVTSLFEEPLVGPVGFVTLDLMAMQGILEKGVGSSSAVWCEKIPMEDLLAWRLEAVGKSSEQKTPVSEKRFEELRESAEADLAEKRWLKAYSYFLEGGRMLFHGSVDLASRQILQSSFEAKFKPILRKISFLLAPKTAVGAKKSKEQAVK